MSVGVLAYPTSLDTRQTLLESANLASTRLTASSLSGATVLTVQDTSGFAATGVLVCEGEIIYYAGKTATTFTGCQGGREGTTSAAHGAGATIANRITSGYMDLRADAIIALENKVGIGTQSIPAQIAAISPAGNDGDYQIKNGSAFGAARMYQGVGASDGLMRAEADPYGPFPSHNFIATKSALTANVSGSAFATGLRIMDVDDGAGNAQWFELLPSYGAMNFQWQHTGSGQDSREFLIDNGRTRITIYGAWRGNVDEGDGIWIATHDNNQFLNQLLLVGEHNITGHTPGFYIASHSSSYQFYFDHDGLNLPNDPVNPLHAATKQYVDAHSAVSGVDLAANYAWTGSHSWSKAATFNSQLKTPGGGLSFLYSPSTYDVIFFSCNSYYDPGVAWSWINPAWPAWALRFQADTNQFQIQQCPPGGNINAESPGNWHNVLVFTGDYGKVTVDPTDPLGIATKQYVDNHVSGGINTAANYAWTGTHTWSGHDQTFMCDLSGGAIIAKGSGAGQWPGFTIQKYDGNTLAQIYTMPSGGWGSLAQDDFAIRTGYSNIWMIAPASGSVNFAFAASAPGPPSAQITVGNSKFPKLRVISSGGNSGILTIEASASAQSTGFAIAAENDSVPPVSVFYAIHSPTNPRFVYYGRGGVHAQTVPQLLAFYTGATGSEDFRRMYIWNDGSVHINEQTLATSTYALTVSSGLNGGFASALRVNGNLDLNSGTLSLWDGAALKQVKIGPAGSGPSGGRALYVDPQSRDGRQTARSSVAALEKSDVVDWLLDGNGALCNLLGSLRLFGI